MKQALRNEITSLKKRHAEEDLHKYSSQIFERLIQTEEFKEAECILAYYSFWGEVARRILFFVKLHYALYTTQIISKMIYLKQILIWRVIYVVETI